MFRLEECYKNATFLFYFLSCFKSQVFLDSVGPLGQHFTFFEGGGGVVAAGGEGPTGDRRALFINFYLNYY